MNIQIDVSADDRTAEQNAKLEALESAAKILRAAGYKAKVSKYVVTKPTDRPGTIDID